MTRSTGPSAVLRQITDRILAALREGTLPWRRPWRRLGAPRRYAGLPFTGANSLILSLAADDCGYQSPYWLTRAQGRRHRAGVLDGERGTWVLRPIFVPRPVPPDSDRDDSGIPLMQSYEVFNAEQFDRLPPRFRPSVDADGRIGDEDRNRAADEFFRATGARVEHGGDRAVYNRASDMIRLPPFARFEDPTSYYATLAHEAIHWTGHRKRMRRHFGARFGDPRYAMEELVAELGAAYLLDRLSLPSRVDTAHASYIDGWIAALERDERAIYAAATHAQRAADYLVIATVSGSVEEVAARHLDDRPWIVVYLDIVEVGSHPLVVAIGVDGGGHKRVLGLRLAGNEPEERGRAARSLLGELMARCLYPDRRRLFVTDGSALLRRAVVDVFGAEVFVQACRVHRKREVLARLPGKKERDAAKVAFADAWERGADGGRGALKRLADGLEPGEGDDPATLLRQNMDDLFTVDRLRLHPRLSRGLTTTHVIDRARAGLPRQVCGVAKWPDPQVALQWAAASFLATERAQQRLAGHRHLQFLKDELAQMEMF